MNIYYYTRTHTCEKIANGVGRKYNVDTRQIIGSIDYSGRAGFLKGGKAAALHQSDPCIYKRPDNDAENILLVTPVWSGTFPPAVRSFIDEVGRERIVLIPVSKGSHIRDRDGFKKIIDIVDGEYKKK